jgi:hypothetical protein
LGLKIIKVEIYKLYNPPHTEIYKWGSSREDTRYKSNGAGRGIEGIGRG